MDSVSFHGHIILGDENSIDPIKISVVKEWPILTLVCVIWSSVGLPGYYQIFVKDFSKIVASLTKLLKKEEKYEWTEDSDVVFEELKSALLLVVPNGSGGMVGITMHLVGVSNVF